MPRKPGMQARERTTMTGQTDEKTKRTGRLRCRLALDGYAALDHHRLSGESMPLLAQKRASR